MALGHLRKCQKFFLGLIFSFILTGCMEQERIPPFVTPSPFKPTSRPYCINGQWYNPQGYYELCQEGVASYYGGSDGCHGSLTATGEKFNMFALTAAHKTLPLPCVIHVENLDNGRKAVLIVNDRGPFIRGRILDVSAQAAAKLGFYKKGLAKVRICTLVKESCHLERLIAQRKARKKALKSLSFTPFLAIEESLKKLRKA